MKKLKQLLAWLLLVGMVMTLASCGKKEESGGKPDDAPASRLFEGEAEVAGGTTSYWCKVIGDRYELEIISSRPGGPKPYSKEGDGFYRLEGFLEQKVASIDMESYEIIEESISYEAVTVRLEKMQNGYYRIIESLDGMPYAIAVELHDDGTYVSHDYVSMALEYRRENNREILHGEAPSGSAFEAWIEGETITSYNCVSGTYSVKDCGAAKLLSFAEAPNAVLYADLFDSMEAMLADNTLTLEADGKTLTMSLVEDNRYFCMADGEELIIEIREDGTFTMLFGAGEVPYTADLVVCEPGKSLRAMIDGGGIAFEIEGDRLTVSGDGMGETIILTEVR